MSARKGEERWFSGGGGWLKGRERKKRDLRGKGEIWLDMPFFGQLNDEAR